MTINPMTDQQRTQALDAAAREATGLPFADLPKAAQEHVTAAVSAQRIAHAMEEAGVETLGELFERQAGE